MGIKGFNEMCGIFIAGLTGAALSCAEIPTVLSGRSTRLGLSDEMRRGVLHGPKKLEWPGLRLSL
ncbi:hypothetical protein ASPVEDRAFT_36660, partial [Aspergillus versicolor CBS 583.65]